MKRIIGFLAVALVLFLPSLALAAIDPVYKECLQRGYETGENETCVFPDGNSCPLEEFNNKTCGLEYRIEAYCVKEGENVWDADRCCPGLEPYLPAGVAGQQTCESKSKIFFSKPFIFIEGGTVIGLVILVGISLSIYFLKRKKDNIKK